MLHVCGVSNLCDLVHSDVSWTRVHTYTILFHTTFLYVNDTTQYPIIVSDCAQMKYYHTVTFADPY